MINQYCICKDYNIDTYKYHVLVWFLSLSIVALLTNMD